MMRPKNARLLSLKNAINGLCWSFAVTFQPSAQDHATIRLHASLSERLYPRERRSFRRCDAPSDARAAWPRLCCQPARSYAPGD
jgi:hypothetical protein